MKYIKLFICVALTALLLCSCGKKGNDETTVVSTTAVPITETSATESTVAVPKTTVKPVTAAATTAEPITEAAEETTTGAKYGDSELLLDTNNRFVDAVVAKYGIDRDGLVTVYSIKGGDNNYVWQFDGSTDENGKYIRTESTLKYVYQINQDLSLVYRTGGYTDNDGFSKREGLTVFMMTQKILLPNLQDQINA